VAYLLSLPALLLFAGVVVIPLAMTVILTFHDWGQYKGIEPVFILKNWAEVFGDPYYGGNAGFVGWDLIGYPGVRTSVTAAEQQMGTKIAPNHRSAYDFAMFRKGGTDGR
jgi:ABC-type sugar transport system permease subunit